MMMRGDNRSGWLRLRFSLKPFTLTSPSLVSDLGESLRCQAGRVRSDGQTEPPEMATASLSPHRFLAILTRVVLVVLLILDVALVMRLTVLYIVGGGTEVYGWMQHATDLGAGRSPDNSIGQFLIACSVLATATWASWRLQRYLRVKAEKPG